MTFDEFNKEMKKLAEERNGPEVQRCGNSWRNFLVRGRMLSRYSVLWSMSPSSTTSRRIHCN